MGLDGDGHQDETLLWSRRASDGTVIADAEYWNHEGLAILLQQPDATRPIDRAEVKSAYQVWSMFAYTKYIRSRIGIGRVERGWFVNFPKIDRLTFPDPETRNKVRLTPSIPPR